MEKHEAGVPDVPPRAEGGIRDTAHYASPTKSPKPGGTHVAIAGKTADRDIALKVLEPSTRLLQIVLMELDKRSSVKNWMLVCARCQRGRL